MGKKAAPEGGMGGAASAAQKRGVRSGCCIGCLRWRVGGRAHIEHPGMLQAHPRRDATAQPVVHTLHTALSLVIAQQRGNLCRAAKPFNQLTVSHAAIKHHVYL